MAEKKTLAAEMAAVCSRLKELSAMDFPRCRTFRQADGTWAEQQPTPEFLEEMALIRRFRELDSVRKALEPHANPLVISLRLQTLSDNLAGVPLVADRRLLWRIAQSVSYNAPCP